MPSKKCLIKTCSRLAGSNTRGLCLLCYSRAKEMVQEQQTTWEQLARLGLASPESNLFDDAYSRAMEDN